MIKTGLTLLLLATLATCQKKTASLVSAEGEAPAIKMIKTTGSLLTAIDISKADLDWDQITAQQEENKKPRNPPKVAGDEYIPEKVDTPPSAEAEAEFQRGMGYIERGKGHGRDGRTAAHRVFERAAAQGHQEARKAVAFSQMFGDYSRWSIQEAKSVFEELEKNGSPDAQLALGFMHGAGIGVEKSNQAKALVYYMFSALGGNPLAQMAMGFRYSQGVGVPQNCESALSYYQKVAKTVVDNVKFTTGQTIQRVRLTDETDPTIHMQPGTAPLDTNLLEYYKMLAEKGDTSAQLGLGQIYLAGGRGLNQNFELAVRYLTSAAESGSADALTYLGKMYLDGTPFTPKDYQKAFEYLTKSVDKSNPSAQAVLGAMYMKGKGVKKNYEKALKLLTLSSDKKNADGQMYLAELNYKGIPTNKGIHRDFKKSVKLYQLASQNGHILAYYNLAQMHATGTGVPRSCSHAVDLFKSVAERGRWGEKLMEAHSAYKDNRQDEAAMKYLFMAELGYEVAQTNLAFILDRQEATSLFSGPRYNNLERAFLNWQRSANQEYAAARVKLGDYYYYGLGTEIDHSLAFSSYKTAVDRHGVAQAMFNLGYMHEVGEGITRDLYLAKRFYDQAIEHSADAYMPAKLALAKLAVVFYLEELNKLPLVSFLEKSVGPRWDAILMTVTALVPLFLFWRHRQNNH
ncbi:CBN-SEL-1 protein [Caenorhabditis brenneri]|uniref:CBN-SEL-1 protein n=1 Tax=Caenorhabditis brenneri TaxID=135651 RepID=G0P566_CAEBE|nr:CBN-SEL-1 protein [Caenorhabditis brenneri]